MWNISKNTKPQTSENCKEISLKSTMKKCIFICHVYEMYIYF